jgi:hypothetical protein
MDDQYHPVAMSETGCTEAFSDGVLAIAVTLLVLDLRVPPLDALHEPLAVALVHEWPAYAAYVTSFLIIGIIWVNHHAVFELIWRVDRSGLFLNLVLLMSVVAIRAALWSACCPRIIGSRTSWTAITHPARGDVRSLNCELLVAARRIQG